jgi:hypothetical protein
MQEYYARFCEPKPNGEGNCNEMDYNLIWYHNYTHVDHEYL